MVRREAAEGGNRRAVAALAARRICISPDLWSSMRARSQLPRGTAGQWLLWPPDENFAGRLTAGGGNRRAVAALAARRNISPAVALVLTSTGAAGQWHLWPPD